mmetsp:Transcript_14710/g.23171  ORF Transcript_14710/g.23171 Transcript_14710/m.23171 type:complete len:308 (+) Transcript_14710:363-1286(+)
MRDVRSAPETPRLAANLIPSPSMITAFRKTQKEMISLIIPQVDHGPFLGTFGLGCPRKSKPSRVMICARAMSGQKTALRTNGWQGPNLKKAKQESRHLPEGISAFSGSTARMIEEKVSPRPTPPAGTVARKRLPPISASNVYPPGRSPGATTSTIGMRSVLGSPMSPWSTSCCALWLAPIVPLDRTCWNSSCRGGTYPVFSWRLASSLSLFLIISSASPVTRETPFFSCRDRRRACNSTTCFLQNWAASGVTDSAIKFDASRSSASSCFRARASSGLSSVDCATDASSTTPLPVTWITVPSAANNGF